jgi:hypothetical protein
MHMSPPQPEPPGRGAASDGLSDHPITPAASLPENTIGDAYGRA